MAEKSLISVIIPVFNEEKYLAKTIANLKSSNYDLEIIVSDGGSTDQTVAVAKKYAHKVFTRQPGERNKNIGENRNKGASLATGDFLLFIDCNVIIENFENFLTTAMKAMEADKRLAGLTIENRFFREQEKLNDTLVLKVMNKSIKHLNSNGTGASTGWTQLVRTEAFKLIGGYNENLITSEDNDLFRRLNKQGYRTVYLNHYTAFGSATRYHQDGWIKVISKWFINTLWYYFFGRSYTKGWKIVEE